MSGNPDNASIWADADVYVAQALTTPNPANVNTPFSAQWDLVGLLDGEAGFEESRSRDSTDFFAWGGLLIRTSRRNFVLTRKFTALEENAIVNKLVWPGSGPGTRAIPNPNARFKMGFETVDGAETKRAITRRFAEVEDVGTIKDSESDLTKFEITMKIYPDADGILFDMQPDSSAATLISVAVTPATKTLAVGAYAPLVATATYSDATTQDVTALATWASANPARVTVDRGYVKGVATGAAANVTASFGGQNGVCAVTVS